MATLKELAPQYREQCDVLKGRVRDLRDELRWRPMSKGERVLLEERIRTLVIIWRENRDIAVLCEHYYERGHRKNGRYTV